MGNSRIQMPKKVACNVVQLDVKGEPYLVGRAAFSNVYHGNLLAEFLREQNILFGCFGDGAMIYPRLNKENEYEVFGMGRAEYDGRTIVFKNEIVKYGLFLEEIGIDKEHAKKVGELEGVEVIFK